MRELASAVRALAPALDADESMERVREHALRAAATATLVLEGTANLSVSVIVGQVRSTANDLLVGTGMDGNDAVEAVAHAVDDAMAKTA